MTDGQVTYRVLGVLGAGGFGKVYRARLETDSGFSKDVAVKVLHDEDPPKSLLKRFRDEARILGLLSDRAIVKVEPPVHLDGRWAVIMDFVDGLSAGQIAERGSLPCGVALEIVGEIARALHNAYNTIGPDGEPLLLLHRDIKPDNIQVTPSGDVMLLDFGIARANFANREYKTKRALGGTPGYIAPERLEAIEDHRGDVYSLGVVLHEIVMGVRPKFSPPTMQFTGAVPSYDADDLEVEDGLPVDVTKVLALAAWMRSYDLEGRPTARQVEEACRALRREIEPPYLREWAEANVPSRTEMEEDERTGTLLTVSKKVPELGLSALAHTPQPPPTTSASGLAVGAVVGGGAVMVFGLIIVVVGVVAVVVLVANSLQQPVPAPAPSPAPVVAPAVSPEAEPSEAGTPEAELPDGGTPELAAPAAPATAPRQPRVITLPGASPSPSPTAAPAVAPSPEPPPAPPEPARTERPTGLVVVRTVPNGATVKERGVTLNISGAGYRLSPGLHVLTIVSPAGESTQIPVQVSTGDRVDICYSFDTNSRCGG
ncbi:MAG: serine/threonine protein kinase [Myxococcota bacterium]